MNLGAGKIKAVRPRLDVWAGVLLGEYDGVMFLDSSQIKNMNGYRLIVRETWQNARGGGLGEAMRYLPVKT